MVDPLSYFLFQPVLHDWCNKSVGMMYKKNPLLLIKKNIRGGNRFPLLLSEWSFAICLMPYTLKSNVLSASLNKTFPSFK